MKKVKVCLLTVLFMFLFSLLLYGADLIVTITVPDVIVADVVNAFCTNFGYQATIGDPPVPNPQTKGQFAKAQLVRYIRDIYRSYKLSTFQTGQATVIQQSDTATTGITVQ